VFSRRALIVAGMLVAAGPAFAADAPVRDPMQPYRYVAGPGGVGAPRFALTAVLISPTRRVAIVNGKPYESGETVNGAEIIRIDPDAVHLREHGNELVVPLGHAVAADKLSQGETPP
jgi:MSHA biogenesis protein MshK